MPEPGGNTSRPPERSQPLTRVYVLRLWQEPEYLTGGGAWRVSLFSPVRRQSRFFSDVFQLCRYLQDLDPTWPDVQATSAEVGGEGDE
jgi:hypothetical protein